VSLPEPTQHLPKHRLNGDAEHLSSRNGTADRLSNADSGKADSGSQATAELVDARGAVQRWLEAPFFALRFLTVLPVVIGRRAPEPGDFGRSDAFFPLVGLGLGAILAAVDWLLQPIVPAPVLNVLLIALLALMTGALHLDGVIDTFDGLFAGTSREQRLTIMRDPRAGSYGVVAVVLVLGLKLAALSALPMGVRTVALVLAPCLGRWGIVVATYVFPYARPEGMGRAFKESIRLQHLVVASVIAVGAASVLGDIIGLAAWVIVGVAVLAAGQGIVRALGGLTGDSYGTICELTEAGVLVAFGLRLGGIA
jgi:adenosylcobinamide-GDP ribazoletransferase